MTRGTTVQFDVDSTPPGAAVKTSNGFTCPATPCTFKLPRKESFDITISKAGHVPQTLRVESKMSGGGGAALAGNILIGGLIGAGVDASSGALNDLVPNPLKVVLQAEAGSGSEPAKSEPSVARADAQTASAQPEATQPPGAVQPPPANTP